MMCATRKNISLEMRNEKWGLRLNIIFLLYYQNRIERQPKLKKKNDKEKIRFRFHV